MRPDGWKETQPANIVTFFNGFAFKSTDTTDKGIKWIKITNVLPGGISWKECNYLPIDFCREYSDFLVKKGDIVVALTRPIINNHLKIGRLENEDDLSLLNQRVAKLVPKNGNYLNYIYHLFRSDDFSNKIQKALMGTDPPNLSMSVLKRFLLPLPPLPEQKKIAAILSTWDRAIEGTEKLLANSQQQKKALMQQLLTGKKRLPGFTGEWKTKQINEIANRIKRTSDGENYPILMISSSIGFVTQDTKYSRYMAGESVNNYILLKEGEFAYNKGNSKLYQFGCIFELREYKQGLVPNVYVCFKINSEQHPDFYRHLFKFDFLKPQLRAIVNSGIRNNGLLNIKPDQFMNTKVPVPPLPEQKAIATVLTTADEEITALESDLSRLRQEKKALMQQLLTGKRRVTVD